MITETEVEIEASPAAVWDIYAEVERWPDWTASIKSVVGLDGPEIAVGHRFEIRQPRFPKLVWVVTAVQPGVSWTWQQKSFGGTTVASHELTSTGSRTIVGQRIEQRGPIGVTVGLMIRGLTKRYLMMEAEGLRARVEQLRTDAATA
jgi:uncharacterized membrane protein